MTTHIPPGPPSRFFGLNQVPKFRQDQLMQTFEACARTYGDVVRITIAGLQQTLVFQPDYVRQILIEQPEKVSKSQFQASLLGFFHGNSLVNSEGDFWKRQRKLAQPAFHSKRIQTYSEKMADHATTILQNWQVGATYNITNEMLKLTLKIVSNSLFGADFSEKAHRIEDMLDIIQHTVMRKVPAMLPLPMWIPTAQHRKTKQAIGELRSLVMDFIQSRRASGEDRGDLLSMLLLAIDDDQEQSTGQMTDIQARDEAISMLIVGHETSASALTWTFYEIARHPEVEAQIRAELDSVLAGRAPTMQDTRQLKYLDKVIKESMRLHPPSWAMPRDAVEDITVGDYLIPKGTGVLFCQHVMHRDARWFPEPDRFLPERFAEGWETKIPKCAYMPFGIGPHNCIGQVFAATEMHIIIALVMQRYRLALVPGQEIVATPLISQIPRNGLYMTVDTNQPSFAQA